MLVLVAVTTLVLLVSPLTALILMPALHLWLLYAAPELRPGRIGSLALVIVGLLPLALVIAFYGRQLGLSIGQVAWTSVTLVASGQVSFAAALLWSIALGCAAAAVLLSLGRREDPLGAPPDEETRVTIRGPLSYAGPGSLGGTESALRR
jgi:hypothetical protein